MNQPIKPQPPQPIHSLTQFDILIGEWATLGTHPGLPSAVQGRSAFEWLRDGALLAWHFDWEPGGGIPSAYSIIGHDDAIEPCAVLYTDERGVARIYQMTLIDGIWKMWRESPGFSQSMTGTFSADGRTITWRGEISRDDSNWESDLTVTFTRNH